MTETLSPEGQIVRIAHALRKDLGLQVDSDEYNLFVTDYHYCDILDGTIRDGLINGETEMVLRQLSSIVRDQR